MANTIVSIFSDLRSKCVGQIIKKVSNSGTYPKNIKCGYKFLGDPGQRIRLEFRDFDLFYGGAQWVVSYISNYYY